MKIPIAYNLRNLVVRRTTTLMTALGIALTVAVLVADLALVNGLESVFRASGNPLQILALRIGSQSELQSSVSRELYQDIKWKPGIARNASGEPMASLEMVTVVNLPSIDDPKGMNVTLRGLEPVGIGMRDVRIRQGRWFRPGHREVVVGASVAQRYPGARLGERIGFGGGYWDVVGVMDSSEPAFNSEIWGDLNQISQDYHRENQLNSVLIRAADAAAVPSLIGSIDNDRRLNLSAVRETQYYASLTSAGAPIEFLGILVALIMAVGSGFAAMNTMYAAVARRSSEIGTLRALGFSRGSILASFLGESLLLALLGGLAGCLLVLPLNEVSTGIGSFMTFSEFTFRFHVGLAAILPGLAFALVIGAFGGLFPARMAARKEILTALREA
jgi:putative ABC transport system permease protein